MTAASRPTVLVAAAVIFHDGKVLLTKRLPRGDLANIWEFPGGKVEAGENPEDTVVRECEEECAAQVEVDDIFDVTYHAYESKDVILLFYLCRLLSLPTKIEHRFVADHAWVLPNRVRDYELPAADHKVVAKVERHAFEPNTKR